MPDPGPARCFAGIGRTAVEANRIAISALDSSGAFLPRNRFLDRALGMLRGVRSVPDIDPGIDSIARGILPSVRKRELRGVPAAMNEQNEPEDEA
jgi:hypothetical protein